VHGSMEASSVSRGWSKDPRFPQKAEEPPKIDALRMPLECSFDRSSLYGALWNPNAISPPISLRWFAAYVGNRVDHIFASSLSRLCSSGSSSRIAIDRASNSSRITRSPAETSRRSAASRSLANPESRCTLCAVRAWMEGSEVDP